MDSFSFVNHILEQQSACVLFMSTCLNVFCSFFFFYFFFLWLLLSIFSTTSDVFVSLQVPKAILMGSLAAFVDVIKKKKQNVAWPRSSLFSQR